jgi:hypothetical protein
MSGILERIEEKLDRVIAHLAQAAPAAQVAPAADPFGGIGAAPAATTPPNITADMITALIQPHLDNAAVKAALGEAMRQHGIDALPNTPPEKYAALYASFQSVIASHAGGGAPAAAAANTSII